jgi:hypothetical protein
LIACNNLMASAKHTFTRHPIKDLELGAFLHIGLYTRERIYRRIRLCTVIPDVRRFSEPLFIVLRL